MPYKDPVKYRECGARAQRKYRARLLAENPELLHERDRAQKLWSRFKLTREQYNSMLIAQDYKCALCGDPESNNGRFELSVDHARTCCPGRRSCGKCVRGLLCNTCNRGIGLLKDNVQLLQRAIDYLLKYF